MEEQLEDYELEILKRCEKCEHWNGEECDSGLDYCSFEMRGDYEGIHCKN